MKDNYETNLDLELAEVKKMLLAKHADYGTSNLAEFGLTGILVRLSDKKARLKTLLSEKREAKVSDETIRDTFKDIAGYSLQALLMIDNALD